MCEPNHEHVHQVRYTTDHMSSHTQCMYSIHLMCVHTYNTIIIFILCVYIRSMYVHIQRIRTYIIVWLQSMLHELQWVFESLFVDGIHYFVFDCIVLIFPPKLGIISS